jgi:hypothetical protein
LRQNDPDAVEAEEQHPPPDPEARHQVELRHLNWRTQRNPQK